MILRRRSQKNPATDLERAVARPTDTTLKRSHSATTQFTTNNSTMALWPGFSSGYRPLQASRLRQIAAILRWKLCAFTQLGAAHGERGGVCMSSSSESMSIAPMIDLLIVLSSGAQAPARYLPPLPAQLRRERLNCIVEPTAHTISRGIKVGAYQASCALNRTFF